MERFFRVVNGSYIILAAVAVSVLSAGVAIVLYIPRDPSFSLFTHWLPTYGTTVPALPAHVFNTGIIILSPLLVLAHLFIARHLSRRGASPIMLRCAMIFGILSAVGVLFVGLIRADRNFTGHLIAALFFFVGGIINGALYGIVELRMREIPRHLGILGIIMAVCFTVFTVLLIAVQIDRTLNPNLPALWEWLSFFSISAWGLAHGIHTLATAPRDAQGVGYEKRLSQRGH